MDILERFLYSVAYKFPKGYPDMNDEQDILLLESILKEDFNIVLEQPVAKENLSKGIEILKKELKLTDEYFPLVSSTTAKVLVPKSERSTFNDTLSKIEGFTKNDNNKFKFEDVTFLIKPIESNPIKVDGELSTTRADTDVKEGLVIVFYDLISRGIPFEGFSTKEKELNLAQLDQIPNNEIESVDIALGSEISSKVNDWLNMAKSKPTDSKVVKVLNNAYSIGNELAKSYPNSQAIRHLRFDFLRTKASEIVGLKPDKWNPADIYLVHEKEGFIKKINDATVQETIAPINDLFNDNWKSTDKPITAISLKEQDYQPGRAGSYLKYRFGDEQTFNPKLYKDMSYEELLELISKERLKLQKLQGNKGGITITYKDSDSKLTEKQARAKLPALKYFNTISEAGGGNSIANFLGMFAFGEGIAQKEKVNPTFFKLVGNNKGGKPKIEVYYRGANAQFKPGSTLEITDLNSNNNVELKGTLEITDGKSTRDITTTKTFRTSGGSVGII